MLLPTSTLAKLFDILPVVSNSFANTLGTAPTAAQYIQPSKMYIRKAWVKTTWQNVCNYGISLEAYYCKPRQNLGTVNNTVDQIYGAGWAQEGSTSTQVTYGTSPFQNHAFVSIFKIYKVKKIFIPAGEGRVLTLSRKKPIIMDYNKFSYASGPTSAQTFVVLYDMLKGISKFILYRFKGIVGNAATDPDYTDVTTGVGIMDFVTEHHYEIQSLLQPLPINTTMASTSANGVLTLPNNPTGGFSFINDAEDEQKVADFS